MHAWLAEGTAVHYFLQATKQKTIYIPEFILAAWRETDFGVGFCLGPNNPRDEIPAFCPPRATSTAADTSPSEMRRLCPSPPPPPPEHRPGKDSVCFLIVAFSTFPICQPPRAPLGRKAAHKTTRLRGGETPARRGSVSDGAET